MSDWANKLADVRKQEMEIERIDKEKILSDRRFVDARKDNKWVELRKATKDKVDELNSAMGNDDIKFEGAVDHNRFYIKVKKKGYFIEVQFIPSSNSLKTNGPTYSLAISDKEELYWRVGDGTFSNYQYSSSDLAETIVEEVFKKIR